MNERKGIITLKGNPVTLVGEEVKLGEEAPEFTCVDNELNPATLSQYKGKTVIISAVPSLDTPICDMQTRWFNSEADKLGEDVVVLTISMDLPFAQKRWCGAAGVKNVVTLSDHRDASFGENYGVLIKEVRLLARAVYIIDKNGVVQYIQLVKEVGSEPDYDDVLANLKNIV